MLRPAVPGDAAAVFEWRNDPWIVSLSASRQRVSWETHARWFQETVAAEDRHLLFIIEDEPDHGVGTVRLDRVDEHSAVVTIYILRPFVGRGLGVAALAEACRAAFARWPRLAEIRARVRADNRPSLRAFAKAGFSRVGDEQEFTGLSLSRATAW